MIRTFLLRLIYFALPIVVFGCLGDLILSGLLKSSKTYASGEFSTWNDIYGGRIDSEVLIYGSSRAVVQIDPHIIEDTLQRSTYNAGIDGHNIWLQYFRHRELLGHNKQPKIILHSLDVTTLTDKGGLFNSDQFLPYMLWNRSIQSTTKSYDFFSTWDFNAPMVRYFGKRDAIAHAIKLLITQQQNNVGRSKGYQPQQLLWNTDLDEARKKTSSIKIEIDSTALAIFNEYLKECQDQGIKIVLIYTPQQIEGQQFIRNKEFIIELYRSIGRSYNIPFLDYSKDSICNSKEFFYNSGHLNEKGSQLFSRQLAHDLKSLL